MTLPLDLAGGLFVQPVLGWAAAGRSGARKYRGAAAGKAVPVNR